MANKRRTFFTLHIPSWILWAVIIPFVFVISFVVAYDLGQRASQSTYRGTKAQEIKRRKDVPINVPLFVSPKSVHYPPRFRFTFDSEETLKSLRKKEGLDAVVAKAQTDMGVFLQLMSWVRAQWSPGRPDPYPPIDAKVILEKIRKGETGGFCAQYCFVLVQCLQSLGFKARYVTLKGHEVTEVWSPEHSKWVMLDPLHELYVTNGSTPLSVLEIHNSIINNTFDLEMHAKKSPDDVQGYLYRYEKFAVWAKNDHIYAPINFFDIERYKIYFLDDPKERMFVPVESLSTFFPEDLYVSPVMMR